MESNRVDNFEMDNSLLVNDIEIFDVMKPNSIKNSEILSFGRTIGVKCPKLRL